MPPSPLALPPKAKTGLENVFCKRGLDVPSRKEILWKAEETKVYSINELATFHVFALTVYLVQLVSIDSHFSWFRSEGSTLTLHRLQAHEGSMKGIGSVRNSLDCMVRARRSPERSSRKPHSSLKLVYSFYSIFKRISCSFLVSHFSRRFGFCLHQIWRSLHRRSTRRAWNSDKCLDIAPSSERSSNALSLADDVDMSADVKWEPVGRWKPLPPGMPLCITTIHDLQTHLAQKTTSMQAMSWDYFRRFLLLQERLWSH